MLPQLYEKFQHWSDGGSVWIYSDPHFDDSDCTYMDPRWPAPAVQIDIINSLVHKGDTLIILGDIGNVEYIKQLKPAYKVLITGNHDAGTSKYKKTICHEIKEINIECTDNEQYIKDIDIEESIFRKNLFEKYPYAKIYINEKFDFYAPFHYFYATVDNNLFDEVYDGPLFIGDKILLSHEPIELGFGLNIHGHTHDRPPFGLHDLNHFNVCSNCVDFKPINLKDIINSGYLKRVETIHRITINKASEHSKH